MRQPDDQPLSDNAADDRLKAALAALGEAPGASVHADTALKAARRALTMLSLGLIMAEQKQLEGNSDSGSWPWPIDKEVT